MELQQEINNLIKVSINPATSKTITVMYQNQLILIPVYMAISSRLSAIFWSQPMAYIQSSIPFMSEFNKYLTEARVDGANVYPDGTRVSDTIAIFAATYKKSTISYNDVQNNILKNENLDVGFKRCSTGIYRYHDFAIIIMNNGRIIDYAIHGYVSNVNDAIYRHNPKRIYYNARPGDALDVFLNYPYQPFYSAMHENLTPIQINRTIDCCFNTLAFCERRAPFCALCYALKDLRGFIFQYKSQYEIIDDNRWYGRRYNHRYFSVQQNGGKNHLNQPSHNAMRRPLKYARKRPGPYNRSSK